MTTKKQFTWFDRNDVSFHNGAMMACLVALECNSETKVGVQVLRSKITGTKSSMFSNNTPDTLECISSTIDAILEIGETHGNLLKDTFDELLTAPNTTCRQHFELEKMSWQGGTKTHTCDQLAEVSKTMCNYVVSNGTWDAIDHKDAQIMALHTKIDELTKTKQVALTLTVKKGLLNKDQFGIAYWQKINAGPMVHRDDKDWW